MVIKKQNKTVAVSKQREFIPGIAELLKGGSHVAEC